MKFVSLDRGYVLDGVMEKVSFLKGVSSVSLHEHPAATKEELYDRIEDAQIVTSRIYVQYNKDFFDHAPKLQAIFTQSVGYNHIDVDIAKQRGVKVFNTYGYNGTAVAEHAFGLLLSLIRNIPLAHRHLLVGGVDYRIFEGTSLEGKILGVIGAGNIGSKLVKFGQGFGMEILCWTQSPTPERAESLGLSKFSSLVNLLENSDVVIICVPLNSDTKGLISLKELKSMKKNAILINVARQTIVNEWDLIKAISKDLISGFAADVFITDPFYANKASLLVQEFINRPNVLITPHIAPETVEANKQLGDVFLANLTGYLNGMPQNQVC